MRVAEKTLYKIVCENREEKTNRRNLKTQINYINVFLNSGSQIKLKNKEGLINIITEVYTAHTNAAYMAGCPSVKKCY